MNAYTQGFVEKCAAMGVDPEALVKQSWMAGSGPGYRPSIATSRTADTLAEVAKGLKHNSRIGYLYRPKPGFWERLKMSPHYLNVGISDMMPAPGVIRARFGKSPAGKVIDAFNKGQLSAAETKELLNKLTVKNMNPRSWSSTYRGILLPGV